MRKDTFFHPYCHLFRAGPYYFSHGHLNSLSTGSPSASSPAPLLSPHCSWRRISKPSVRLCFSSAESLSVNPHSQFLASLAHSFFAHILKLCSAFHLPLALPHLHLRNRLVPPSYCPHHHFCLKCRLNPSSVVLPQKVPGPLQPSSGGLPMCSSGNLVCSAVACIPLNILNCRLMSDPSSGLLCAETVSIHFLLQDLAVFDQ